MWKERLRKHRRRLHRIPEIGDDLPRTKEYLLKVLSGLDCEIIPVMDSGLLAYFDGGKEETLAFRGDMDGLPIEEKTGRDYKSTHEGKMPICVHTLFRMNTYRFDLLGTGPRKYGKNVIPTPAFR